MIHLTCFRVFAKASVLGLFLFVLQPAFGFSSSPTSKKIVSILQGVTDETSTQLSVATHRYPEKGISIQVEGDGIETKVQKVRNFNDYTLYRVDVEKLKSNTLYTLKVFFQPEGEGEEKSEKQLIDERNFKNLVKSNKLKFAAASCMFDGGEYLKIAEKIWPELASQNPDTLFLIGDAVYADAILKDGKRVAFANEEDLWTRYFEVFTRLPLMQFKKLIPTFALWDDHDFGMNNGGKSYQFAPQAKAVFESFFPRGETTNYKKGPGISAHLTLAGQNFFFMDNRTFRDPSDKVSGQQGEHWGKAQLNWLIKQIRSSNKPSWLINGDQFFGAYHRFESFEGHHPKALEKTLGRLKQQKPTFVMLTGDRHLFEFMEIEKKQLGYKTYELTTSAMHAKMYPGRWESIPNPRQKAGVAQKPNYALVESSIEQGRKAKHNVRMAIYTLDKSLLHSEDVTISK